LFVGLVAHALGGPFLASSLPEAKALGALMPNRSQLRDAERETKRLRRDPHRRRRYLSHVRADHTVIRSALATLEALLQHSDDSAGPAFPSQARLARLAGVDVRTVRRHLQELRDAGVLLIYVYAPDRDAASGRYRRRKTNRYYFRFSKTPGGGHRVRRNHRSHLEDTDVLTNPFSRSNHRPSGGSGGSPALVIQGAARLLQPHRPAASADTGHYRWSNEKGCVECDFTGFVLDVAFTATPCACSSTFPNQTST
jgi:DNA-binding transcriptional ArsR family regulator